MKQRDLGKRSGLSLPGVNMGAMRLPKDLDDAVAIVRHGIDAGMVYIDTARGYRECEWVVGRALRDGYRDKVILSAKWSPWNLPIRDDDDASADVVRRRLEESMNRLDVDYLDFYQIWNVHSRESYDKVVCKGGMLEGILKAKDEGLIGHIGFTTHDTVENILTYIDEVDWCESILFTYNMLNLEYAPAIKAAHEKGIGTVVMNPVGGGRLVEASPILMDLAERVGAVSVPDLAIRFILSNPNIDAIISGVTCVEDADLSLASGKRESFSPDAMREIELFLANATSEKSGFCTSCEYCLPCPQGINIPAILDCIYKYRHWGLKTAAKMDYARINKSPKADACNACGQCEVKCTQKLKISEEMKFAAKLFASEA